MITLDTSTKASNSDTAALSFSHGGAAAGVKLALVCFAKRDTVNVTSVTYGAVAMTQVSTINGANQTFAYYLVNPPQGTQTVVVTLSGTTTFDSVVASTWLGNVDTINPIGATQDFNSMSANIGSFSSAITLQNSNSVVIGIMLTIYLALGTTITQGTGYTELQEINDNITLSDAGKFMQTENQYKYFATGGAQTVDWSFSTANNTYGGAIAFEIKSTLNTLTLLDVGT